MTAQARTQDAAAAVPELQERFDGLIAADERIEPRDWMPEAYRKKIGRAHV